MSHHQQEVRNVLTKRLVHFVLFYQKQRQIIKKNSLFIRKLTKAKNWCVQNGLFFAVQQIILFIFSFILSVSDISNFGTRAARDTILAAFES